MEMRSSRQKLLQARAQFVAGVPRHAAANSHRKMVGARERPDVAFESAQEFHLDGVAHGRERSSRGSFPGRSRRERARVRAAGHCARRRRSPAKSASCAAPPSVRRTRFPASIHLRHTRAHDAAARGCGAIQQQAVEHRARVDDDGMIEVEQRAMAAAGDEFHRVNRVFWVRTVQQKRIGDARPCASGRRRRAFPRRDARRRA